MGRKHKRGLDVFLASTSTMGLELDCDDYGTP